MQSVVDALEQELKKINREIFQLYQMEPIFGFISVKYIKCGKKNCKCKKNPKYKHGPYYYLRQEPEYKYNRYLGKEVPKEILERIRIGERIRDLERKKLEIEKALMQVKKIE